MHGRGGEPSDWQGAMEWLAGKIGGNCKVVCPAAPLLALTVAGGEQQPAWFDIKKRPLTPESEDDLAGVAKSTKLIHKMIDALVHEDGIPADKILVGGFSQGAVTAVPVVYSYPQKLAGCLMLSGWVPNRANLNITSANQDTPVFWGHGAQDEVALISCQEAGRQAFTEKKVPVETKAYDIGHDSNEAEFEDILAFTKKVLD